MPRFTKCVCLFSSFLLLFIAFLYLGEYVLCSLTNGQWRFGWHTCEYPTQETQIPSRNQQQAMINVESPSEGSLVTSPLRITGKARGTWFFEASFPVVLVDWDGRILAQGIAQAQSDWMTEAFVPFTAELEFEKPIGNNRGSLILKKDNPSGLPEYAGSIEIPLFFAP